MPYIKQDRRDDLTLQLDSPRTPGELNFMLTRQCDEYMKRGHKSYQEINDIVGALECCKMEFYRRIAVPYEEIKMAQNGDVYV